MELIRKYHDNLLAGHFEIEKIQDLFSRKYYWPTLHHDVKDYVKGYNICRALKAVCHKLYKDLQSLLMPTYCWKDLFMDFVTDLPILMN